MNRIGAQDSTELFDEKPRSSPWHFEGIDGATKGDSETNLNLAHIRGQPRKPNPNHDPHPNMCPHLTLQEYHYSAVGSDNDSSLDLTLTLASALARGAPAPRSEERIDLRPMTSAKLFWKEHKSSLENFMKGSKLNWSLAYTIGQPLNTNPTNDSHHDTCPQPTSMERSQ